MGRYHIDAEGYSLRRFKADIESRNMIPSRVILKDDLDERFEILEHNGITNLQQLKNTIKTKPKIADFSEKTGLTVDYLTLLRREANSYLPNPVRINAFLGIPKAHVDQLEAVGIRNSRQLFNAASDEDEIDQLSLRTDIPAANMNELLSMADLVRAYGIGPVFARMLYDAGIKSIKHFVRYSADELISIYEEKENKKADFGFDELQFSIDLAKHLYVSDDS